MRAIMDTAMRAGAMGMTTALIYPPSSYATTDELVEVAKAAAQYGGIYASHIRGEGKEVVESVREAIAIGERRGMPVEVFHLKVAYRPGVGHPDGLRATGRRGGARARRRRRRRHVRLHRGRHGTRGDDPELGVRRRQRFTRRGSRGRTSARGSSAS